MQPGQPLFYPQHGYPQPGYPQPGYPLPGQPSPQISVQPLPANAGYTQAGAWEQPQQPCQKQESPLKAIVPPSTDSVSVNIGLPGNKVEEEVQAGPALTSSEGREIDARRRAPEPRPGASVPLSFNDPKNTVIVEPNFIFPDHTKPDIRPWLPTFTEKWYTFDDPIDNNLVRGASFMVFLTAIMIFIFGMKT
eukprot:2473732-Rhodomonas_salina.1